MRLSPAGVPCITDCVMAELEKLGPKFRLALRLAKDTRFSRIPCAHKGTYADDCLVNRVTEVRTDSGNHLPPIDFLFPFRSINVTSWPRATKI